MLFHQKNVLGAEIAPPWPKSTRSTADSMTQSLKSDRGVEVGSASIRTMFPFSGLSHIGSLAEIFTHVVAMGMRLVSYRPTIRRACAIVWLFVRCPFHRPIRILSPWPRHESIQPWKPGFILQHPSQPAFIRYVCFGDTSELPPISTLRCNRHDPAS